jgi:hypothetical protein
MHTPKSRSSSSVARQRVQLARSRSQEEPDPRTHGLASIADLAARRHRCEDGQPGRELRADTAIQGLQYEVIPVILVPR